MPSVIFQLFLPSEMLPVMVQVRAMSVFRQYFRGGPNLSAFPGQMAVQEIRSVILLQGTTA